MATDDEGVTELRTGSPTETVQIQRALELRAGVVLAERYALERPLGRGGMGEVWLSSDRVLSRKVAAKIIRPLDANLRERTRVERSFRQAFTNEARIGAQLSHPAIATVFDFGFVNDEPFIIFEYIPGETLQALLQRRGRLSLDDVRAIVANLAQALDYAHAAHVVHRDLKPENIRATGRGEFKILDLGIAKVFRDQAEWSGFAGTPAYTSPEQASGSTCDGRSDQYALGIIAYEMLTGHRPFTSDDVGELLRMQRELPPPSPLIHVPDLLPSAEEALLRALAKDPGRRFQTCVQFALALGCQFVRAATRVPQLLRVGRARAPRGTILTWGKSLGLTANCLWILEPEAIRAIPLDSILDVQRAGWRNLMVQHLVIGQAYWEYFLFPSRAERQSWYELLTSMQKPSIDVVDPRAAFALARIVRMPRALDVQHQSLGRVEFEAHRDSDAATAIEIQAAMLGAEAIIEPHRERLPKLTRTMFRQSGTAIRAVNSAGRSELHGRWFSMETKRVANSILAFAISFLIYGAFTLAFGMSETPHSSAPSGKEFTLVLAGWFVWPLLVAVALRATLLPQLLVPAAVTMLVFSVAHLLFALVASLVGPQHAAISYLPPMAKVTGSAGIAAIIFSTYLVSTSLSLLRHYASVVPRDEEVSTGRRTWRAVAWAALVVYVGLALIPINDLRKGFLRRSSSTLVELPRTASVVWEFSVPATATDPNLPRTGGDIKLAATAPEFISRVFFAYDDPKQPQAPSVIVVFNTKAHFMTYLGYNDEGSWLMDQGKLYTLKKGGVIRNMHRVIARVPRDLKNPSETYRAETRRRATASQPNN